MDGLCKGGMNKKGVSSEMTNDGNEWKKTSCAVTTTVAQEILEV